MTSASWNQLVIKQTLMIGLMIAFASSSARAAAPVNLAGEWRFALDPKDLGATASPSQWRFPDKVKLPGTPTAQGFGEIPSPRTQWTGVEWRHLQIFGKWKTDDNFKMPFCLQPDRYYVGPAWYQRDFDWSGGRAVLHLERVHWHSTVWLDGKQIGKGESLGTPHEFELGSVEKGKHTLTLRVDNRIGAVNVGPNSHSVTDHTQGNWNGVVGRMEVRHAGDDRITRVRAFPMADGTVKLHIAGNLVSTTGGETPVVSVRESAGAVVGSGKPTRGADGTFALEILAKPSQPVKRWNEFAPNLYQWSVCLECGDDMPADRKDISFGFREVGTSEGRITLDGRKIFLRGTLECCIFPLTGYPPTDVDSWKRIIRICKAHGLNHIRFHSWCPPEAAFIAADELGFYYQVEASSWANSGAEIGSGRPLDAWLEDESKRMLEAYGNHPSFLLMAYGNEPAGGNLVKWLTDWVARRKAEDPRRLYTTAAGWPLATGSDYHNMPQPRIQGWGQGMHSVINGQPPRTNFDWRAFVSAHADAPIVSHEIGQWCVYPNFDEIGKYTGLMKPRNFEIFRETAQRNGLFGQARDFLMSSGRLQTLAYKHDIEAALRTPEFGGFQLLDLHDFPGQGTALVGVLDPFWDGKGYVSPEEFRSFCAPVVPLAVLEKMVYQNSATLTAEIQVAQFGPDDLKQAEVAWKLATANGETLGEGKLPARDLATGELHSLGSIKVPLGAVKRAVKAVLTVRVPQAGAANHWDVFIYPEEKDLLGSFATPGKPVKAGDIEWTDNLAVAKELLAKGCRVLWVPDSKSVADDGARPLQAGFSPIFWNTAWTAWQPPHTLGILCDPRHPALDGFPTDCHSNWQWWELQKDARPFILTRHQNLKPIVQIIDDWVTNRKLGYVFEAKVGPGKLLACSAAVAPVRADKPAAAALLASLQRYLGSGRFDPATELTPADLDALAAPARDL